MIDPKDVGIKLPSGLQLDYECLLCYRDPVTDLIRPLTADEAIAFVKQAQKDHLDAASYSDLSYEQAKASNYRD